MARTTGIGPGSSTRPRRRWCAPRGTLFDSLLTSGDSHLFKDYQSDVEDDDERGFSQINALSSPASTPPQVELPDSPGLAEKINGPSASAIAAVEPLRRLSPDALERSLSHRTSTSADDVEADLIPASPTPSINASQNSNSNSSQEDSSLHPHLLSSHPPPVLSQTQFPPSSANVSRFRRGMFQIHSSAQVPARPEPWMTRPSQSQGPLTASQALPSLESSQVNGNEMGWLNTQAFRPPETQESYESD